MYGILAAIILHVFWMNNWLRQSLKLLIRVSGTHNNDGTWQQKNKDSGIKCIRRFRNPISGDLCRNREPISNRPSRKPATKG